MRGGGLRGGGDGGRGREGGGDGGADGDGGGDAGEDFFGDLGDELFEFGFGHF